MVGPVSFDHSRSYPLYAVSPERCENTPFTDSSSTFRVTIIAPGRGPRSLSVSVQYVYDFFGLFFRPLFLFNGNRIAIIRWGHIIDLTRKACYPILISTITFFCIIGGFFRQDVLAFNFRFLMATLYASFNENYRRGLRFHVQRCNYSSISSIRRSSFFLTRFLLLLGWNLTRGIRYYRQASVQKSFRNTSAFFRILPIRRNRKTLNFQIRLRKGLSLSRLLTRHFFLGTSINVRRSIFRAVRYGNPMRNTTICVSMSSFFNWIFDRNAFPTKERSISNGGGFFRISTSVG